MAFHSLERAFASISQEQGENGGVSAASTPYISRRALTLTFPFLLPVSGTEHLYWDLEQGENRGKDLEGCSSEQPRLLSLGPAPCPSQTSALTPGLPGFPGRLGRGGPLFPCLPEGRSSGLGGDQIFWYFAGIESISFLICPTYEAHPWLSTLLCQGLCGPASPKGQYPSPTPTQVSGSFLTNCTGGSPNPGLGKDSDICPQAH